MLKTAKIEKRQDGYYVVSEKGKNLGGPYGSREKAEERLGQVEYFKHKEASYLTDQMAKHAISAQDIALPAIGGAIGAATGRTLFGGTDRTKTIATIAGLLAGAGGGELLRELSGEVLAN